MSSKESENPSSYIRPPRTRKPEPCYCLACNGKLIDPRTKASHSFVSQREIKESSNPSPPINLIYSLEDLMDISDEEPQEEPQESHEERYSFLVRRMTVTSQKKRKSK